MPALPGTHLCLEHQGNHSHYSKDNCELCCLKKELAADAAFFEKAAATTGKAVMILGLVGLDASATAEDVVRAIEDLKAERDCKEIERVEARMAAEQYDTANKSLLASLNAARSALADAVEVIEGLAGQQAMDDPWYEPELARFREMVTPTIGSR